MVSLRIKTIASLIDKKDIILDVGTDHAYLPIYLVNENLAKKVYASDISEKVLLSSKENIVKNDLEDKIKLFLSNGLDNICVKYNTLVITGMGFHTIKNILDKKILPNKIILQTNSDHDKLRLYMMKLGYKIDKEITIKDKNIFYVIIKYIKGVEKLTKSQILFGKSQNKEYYNHLLNKYNKIYPNLPIIKKIKFYTIILRLKKLSK